MRVNVADRSVRSLCGAIGDQIVEVGEVRIRLNVRIEVFSVLGPKVGVCWSANDAPAVAVM